MSDQPKPDLGNMPPPPEPPVMEALAKFVNTGERLVAALAIREAAVEREQREGGVKPDPVDGLEVIRRVLTYGLGTYASWWGARRAMRKAEAPEWAVVLAGRLSLLLAGHVYREAADLDGDGAKEVGTWLGEKIEGLFE